jgi:hypothetical protein
MKSSVKRKYLIESEVLAEVDIKVMVFWDVVLSNLVDNRRFGGTCCLHLQGRRRLRQQFFSGTLVSVYKTDITAQKTIVFMC